MTLIYLMIIPGFLWLLLQKAVLLNGYVNHYKMAKKNPRLYCVKTARQGLLTDVLELIVLIVAFKALV